MTLRQSVALQMVRVHEIPLSLAKEHVGRMDREELLDRFKKYWRRSPSGVALGVAVGCALALRELSRPGTSTGEYGGTKTSDPCERQQCVPPQGAEGVGLILPLFVAGEPKRSLGEGAF